MTIRLAAPVLLCIGLACALPARAESLVAELWLNGGDTGLVAELHQDGKRLEAPAELLRQAGLNTSADGYVDLGALAGVQYRLREDTQALELTADPKALQGSRFSGKRTDWTAPDKASLGALLNYSVDLLHSDGGVDASAYGEARVFGPLGTLSGSFVAGSATQTPAVRRLDTAYTLTDPGHVRRLIVGDFITSSLPWTRPIRAGGVSLASDFASRPDIITEPLPQLKGEAAAPSSIDLYIDGLRRFSTRTEAGPFTIDQAPVVDGHGQVSLVVTDVTGRQTVQSFPFYLSSDLLRPGLVAYALDAGAARRDYGGPGDRYADGFVSGSLQAGLTDWATGQLHFEAVRGLRQAGAGLVVNLWRQALLDAAVNLSNSGRGSGGQLRLGLQRRSANLDLFASLQTSFGRFDDVASIEGDELVRRQAQVGASYATGRYGAFSLNYSQLRTTASRNDAVTFGWSRELAHRATLYASAYVLNDGSAHGGVSVGLTVPLGARAVVNVEADRSGGQSQLQAYASQSPPVDGGLGWQAQARTGSGGQAQGELRRLDASGEQGAGLSWTSHGLAERAYATGSVVMMGGAPRLARQINGALVMVETGYPGVAVKLENRPLGKTDRTGRLLAAAVLPYASSHLAIDPQSVPLDADIEVERLVIRPPRGAGMVARLPVRRSRAVSLVLIASDGAALPAGSAVRVNGERAGVIGYGGAVYLPRPQARNSIEVDGGFGQCVADYAPASAAAGDKPVRLACRMLSLRGPVS